jgi:hypothetical protein
MWRELDGELYVQTGVVVRLEITAAGKVIGACGGVPFLPQQQSHYWQGNYCGATGPVCCPYQPSFSHY